MADYNSAILTSAQDLEDRSDERGALNRPAAQARTGRGGDPSARRTRGDRPELGGEGRHHHAWRYATEALGSHAGAGRAGQSGGDRGASVRGSGEEDRGSERTGNLVSWPRCRTGRPRGSAPNGIRIRVCGLKGRRPSPLDDGGASVETSAPASVIAGWARSRGRCDRQDALRGRILSTRTG